MAYDLTLSNHAKNPSLYNGNRNFNESEESFQTLNLNPKLNPNP